MPKLDIIIGSNRKKCRAYSNDFKAKRFQGKTSGGVSSSLWFRYVENSNQKRKTTS